MNILEPPAERDMPVDRSTRMRAHLLASIRRPPSRRSVALRRSVVVLAGAAAIAGLSVPALTHRDGGDGEALAMSAVEMSRPLREVSTQCLKWNAQERARDGSTAPAVNEADLAMVARRNDLSVAMFLTDSGHYSCDISMPPGREISGGSRGEDWQSPDWMPGPVQVVGLSSTEIESGHVMVAGRVSERVHRVVLHHGNGDTTTARIDRGVFGMISNGPVVKNAELVSYEVGGAEVGRRLLFQSLEIQDCYVDPAGRVVYGEPGRKCLPAEPWSR